MSRIPHIFEPLIDTGSQKINDNWHRFLDAQAASLVSAESSLSSLDSRLDVLEALPAGYTTLGFGTLSGSAVVLATSIPATYARLFLRIAGMSFDSASRNPLLQVSTDDSTYDTTAGNYAHQFLSGATTGAVASASLISPVTHALAADTSNHTLDIADYQGGYARSFGMVSIGGAHLVALAAYFGSTSPITALRLVASAGNFDGGAWALIGVR